MAIETCPICGQFKFSWKQHKCPPIWNVVMDDEFYEGEEPQRIRADSAKEAAERYAVEYDSGRGTYPLANGGSVEVKVTDPGTGKVSRFRVDGRIEPVYYATELVKEGDSNGNSQGQ